MTAQLCGQLRSSRAPPSPAHSSPAPTRQAEVPSRWGSRCLSAPFPRPICWGPVAAWQRQGLPEEAPGREHSRYTCPLVRAASEAASPGWGGVEGSEQRRAVRGPVWDTGWERVKPWVAGVRVIEGLRVSDLGWWLRVHPREMAVSHSSPALCWDKHSTASSSRSGPPFGFCSFQERGGRRQDRATCACSCSLDQVLFLKSSVLGTVGRGLCFCPVPSSLGQQGSSVGEHCRVRPGKC